MKCQPSSKVHPHHNPPSPPQSPNIFYCAGRRCSAVPVPGPNRTQSRVLHSKASAWLGIQSSGAREAPTDGKRNAIPMTFRPVLPSRCSSSGREARRDSCDLSTDIQPGRLSPLRDVGLERTIRGRADALATSIAARERVLGGFGLAVMVQLDAAWLRQRSTWDIEGAQGLGPSGSQDQYEEVLQQVGPPTSSGRSHSPLRLGSEGAGLGEALGISCHPVAMA